jgi:hypothetical protein
MTGFLNRLNKIWGSVKVEGRYLDQLTTMAVSRRTLYHGVTLFVISLLIILLTLIVE